jgi:hypothetical protein
MRGLEDQGRERNIINGKSHLIKIGKMALDKVAICEEVLEPNNFLTAGNPY